MNKESYLKNWIAFKVLIDSVIEDHYFNKLIMPEKEYLIEKFNRIVLSDREDEYRRGIHPLLLTVIYDHFEKYNLPLDEEDLRLKDLYSEI